MNLNNNPNKSKQTEFQCDICLKYFSSRQALSVHKRTHTGEKPYPCDECGRNFSTTDHLNKHKRIHSGEKPYRCDECGRNFSQRISLNKHKRTHTGETPYRCDECGRTFSYSNSLNRHKRINPDGKSFICDKCNKSFTSRNCLNYHCKTCNNTYICDGCGVKFSRKLDLFNHIKVCGHSNETDQVQNTISIGSMNPSEIQTNPSTASANTQKPFNQNLVPIHNSNEIESVSNYDSNLNFNHSQMNVQTMSSILETHHTNNNRNVNIPNFACPYNRNENQNITFKNNIHINEQLVNITNSQPHTNTVLQSTSIVLNAHSDPTPPIHNLFPHGNSNENDLTTNVVPDQNLNQYQTNIQGLQSSFDRLHPNSITSHNFDVDNSNNLANFSHPFNRNESQTNNLNHTVNINQEQYTNELHPRYHQECNLTNNASTNISLNVNAPNSNQRNAYTWTYQNEIDQFSNLTQPQTLHPTTNDTINNFESHPSHGNHSNNIMSDNLNVEYENNTPFYSASPTPSNTIQYQWFNFNDPINNVPQTPNSQFKYNNNNNNNN